MNSSPRPRVSIVLPTFNRRAFLPQAFASIAAQQFTDWELIVVDDGSTDDSRSVVEQLRSDLAGPLSYIRQDNRGAYGARNTGWRRAQADYIAFFDSDDVWYPMHLSKCVSALDRHPEIDWAFGAVRRIDHATGAILDDNSFYPAGQPRPFLRLRTRDDGDLKIIDDPDTLTCQLEHGLYCGLQNSVIRRRVFDHLSFREECRVVEDEMFFIRSLARGARVGYFLEPHVLYNVHDGNSSAAAQGQTAAQSLAIAQELVDALERLPAEVALTGAQERVLRKRLGQLYFWHLGYNSLWPLGRRGDAFACFRKAIRLEPWNLGYWKAYLAAVVRAVVSQPEGTHS